MIEQNEISKDGGVSETTTPSKEYEQASNQYNKQDLDQVQFNSQNLNISISDKSTGKIMGVVFLKQDKVLLQNIEISLFFGDKTTQPVLTTKSDKNGYYEFNELPPGYYTIVANANGLEYIFQYIKLSIGQSVFQLIPIAV